MVGGDPCRWARLTSQHRGNGRGSRCLPWQGALSALAARLSLPLADFACFQPILGTQVRGVSTSSLQADGGAGRCEHLCRGGSCWRSPALRRQQGKHARSKPSSLVSLPRSGLEPRHKKLSGCRRRATRLHREGNKAPRSCR